MAELVKDLVCGMEIDPETAAGTSQYQGTTYYFCAEGCKQEFDANPAKFVGGGVAPTGEAPVEAPVAAATEEKPARKWWEFWKS